ncbi:hypothetical protein WDU94_012383, partial [Cyamophila willieti]
VRASMRIKLKKTKKPANTQIKFCLESLKDPEIQNQYQRKLEECLGIEPPEEVQRDIDQNWKQCKDMILDVTNQTLKSKRKKDKVWFNRECQKKVEERKHARDQWLNNTGDDTLKELYQSIRRETQIYLRRKKREFYNNILMEAEDDFNHHRARQMYQKIKKATQPFKQRQTLVKDKDGNMLTNEERISRRWVEYFDELLNAEEPQDMMECYAPSTVDIQVAQPTLEEVEGTINKLKNNKACGEDQIYAELIKKGGSELVFRIKYVIDDIWEQERMPNDWKTALISPIHKKSDPLDCNNYRGIALLNIAYKILSLILLKRLIPLAESIVGEYQYGFRSGRSTVDQIFVLRQLSEKSWEFNRNLHLIFLDCIKAYDSVHRETLLNILREFEIPNKLINLISMCTSETFAKIKTPTMISEPFQIHSGLRQGDPLSPVLFNLVLEKIDRELQKSISEKGLQMERTRINRLAYADDIVLISETKEDLIKMTEEFGKIAAKIGLKISIDKSEYMTCGRNNESTLPLVVNDQTFKKVKTFKYLGSLINDQNDKSVEIQARINAANKAYFSLQQVMKKRSLSKTFKIRLYRSNIIPVLLYGCEAQTYRLIDENKLLIFERKILRRIYGPIFDPTTDAWRILKNREIEAKYAAPNIVQVMKERRLKFAGHVARMDEERMPRRVMVEGVNGRRSKGRPKLRWLDNIKKDVTEMGMNPDRWLEYAQDRHRWRSSVEQTYGRLGPSQG